MTQCPHCGKLVLDEASVCPHCGTVIPPVPVLEGSRVQQIGQRLPLRGFKNWALAILGFVVAALSPGLWLIGFVIAWLVYATSKKKEHPFMRGMYYGLLLFPVLLLGAFAICLWSVFGPHGIGSH